jgi:hypothetical protein
LTAGPDESTAIAVSDRKAAVSRFTAEGWGNAWFKYDEAAHRWDVWQHDPGGMILKLCYSEGEWADAP